MPPPKNRPAEAPPQVGLNRGLDLIDPAVDTVRKIPIGT